jgi:hypothetical protein
LTDFAVAQPVVIAIESIELDRHLAYRCLAATGDVRKRAFDRCPDLAVFVGNRFGLLALLEVSHRQISIQ